MTSLLTHEHAPASAEPTCKFCRPALRAQAVLRLGTVLAVEDAFPVTDGHHLVLPVRHADDFFALTPQEQADTLAAVAELRRRLLAADATIEGFNVGMNCGTAAGQTVPHAHTHLIPRRAGDTSEPRGGVRGAVPDRMAY